MFHGLPENHAAHCAKNRSGNIRWRLCAQRRCRRPQGWVLRSLVPGGNEPHELSHAQRRPGRCCTSIRLALVVDTRERSTIGEQPRSGSAAMNGRPLWDHNNAPDKMNEQHHRR
jgi:hypothetical protein